MTTPPPLLPPDQMPPIRTADDMCRRWAALMGPLGFSERRLWCAYLTADGRMLPTLQQVDDVADRPDPQLLDGLMQMCGAVLDGIDAEGSVAFLLSRPGPAQMTEPDRAWARGLTAAAGSAGIGLQPVHLATDEAIRVFAADDLLSSRPS